MLVGVFSELVVFIVGMGFDSKADDKRLFLVESIWARVLPLLDDLGVAPIVPVVGVIITLQPRDIDILAAITGIAGGYQR